MASFSGPSLSNRIADDVPDIQALLSSLAKLTPDSGNVDYPVGTKRVAETANGYELQQYNGSSWVTLEQWNIDAQKLDGYSASTGTSASTIPVRNSAGKIPGDITGTAEKANEAKTLSETNPVGKGGTGATSVAEARANLGVAPISHASSGVEYGVSSENQYGHAKASATTPKALGTASAGTEATSFARGDHVHPTTPATGSVVGMVKLSDSTSSTSAASNGVAATPKAVKAAYDRGTEGVNAAQSAAQSAANSRITNATIDGLDLVLTYGDGTTKRVKLPAGKSVGDLWMGFDQKSKPANVQLYAGQVLSRSSYSAHWNYVNGGARTVLSESAWQAQVKANGFCPYYSSGNGSTTYRMPLIKGVHPKFVAALAEAGQYIKAGLPNITGRSSAYDTGSNLADCLSGAFYAAQASGKSGGYSHWTEGTHNKAFFSASCSNSIYGASTTVQPPSVTCILGEYVVGAVAVVGEADAKSLLASVTTLESNVGALKSASGFNAAGKAEIVGWGMPDYSAGVRKTSGTQYTAETNGHLEVYVSMGTVFTMIINGVSITYPINPNGQGYKSAFTFLLKKGTIYKATFGTEHNGQAYFYPIGG